ncbi:MAG: hypothetical protein V3U92_13485 [Cellulophaga sp.]
MIKKEAIKIVRETGQNFFITIMIMGVLLSVNFFAPFLSSMVFIMLIVFYFVFATSAAMDLIHDKF